MRRLTPDERAQSIGIIRYVLALIVGAIVVFIVWTVTDPILMRAGNATTNTTANTGTQWFQTASGYLPVIFLGLSFFGIIVIAVYQREVFR
jgi:Na+-driven multidrug efflux pump